MNKVRSAATAAIFALFATAHADAKPTALIKETNLRREPTTASDVVILIPKGTRIDIGQCTKGWCKASWNGQEGYVIIQNLALAAMRPLPGRVIRGVPYEDADVYAAEPAYPPPPPPAYNDYGPSYPRPYYYGGPYIGFDGGSRW